MSCSSSAEILPYKLFIFHLDIVSDCNTFNWYLEGYNVGVSCLWAVSFARSSSGWGVQTSKPANKQLFSMQDLNRGGNDSANSAIESQIKPAGTRKRK
ncbi:hypothetical protein V6N13_036009 [Hibiscus sabdariffa]